MSRRSREAAEAAAQAASEAARLLQQRGQEVRNQESEPAPEPAPEPAYKGPQHPLKSGNPEREAILAEIRQRRGEPVEEEKEPEVKAEAKPEAEPEVKDEPKKEEPQAEAVPEVESPKTVKVKVDGEEMEVPAEEVEEAGGVKAYQIQKASENRLRKMNEALAEIKRVSAELSARQAPKEPEKPKESDQEFIASKMDIVRFGEPKDSAAAWLEIQQRLQPKLPDQNMIIEAAANRIKHDHAVAAFDREFSDISTNPILLRLVVALRNERISEAQRRGEAIEWDVFYRKIGNEVRSAVGRPSQASSDSKTAGTTSQVSEKEARKASIVNLPKTGAKADPPKEEKPETREEAIARMRRSRGQQTG